MSLSLSEMQQLMHELGPATPEIDAIVQHEAGSWDVWFSNAFCLSIEWRLAEPRLTLSLVLGDAPPSAASDCYSALLKANLAWSAQGSVRAVMCDADQLMLIAEPVLADAELSALQAHLRRFVCQAAQFAALLHPAADRLPGSSDPDCLASITRV